ncbi:hypothetical protein Hanom_Chr11g00972121 [Helianthus anomalus]
MSVYIPPSPDPMSSVAICGWVWLLLLLLKLIKSVFKTTFYKYETNSNRLICF